MASSIVIGNKEIRTPIIDILKKIKSELNNNKLNTIQFKNDEIRVTCPFHKDGLESHPSCNIYCGDDNDVEYGFFNCFTCGSKGPFYHFVGACFDKDDAFGKKWLIENFGNNIIEFQMDLPPIIIDKENKKFNYLDESILKDFQNYHPYMNKRKLIPDICKLFEVKYDSTTQCLVFPVRDETGKLIMLTRRSVLDKKFIIDEGIEKPIYLYYYIKQNNIKEITICESQINALTLWGYSIPAVALFGTGTKLQYNIINKSNLTHIYLCLDGDEAGKKGTIKLLRNIKKDIFVDVIEMKKGKDVNDLTEEEFNSLPIINGIDWLKKNKIQL